MVLHSYNRIDQALAAISGISRNKIHTFLSQRKVTVNNVVIQNKSQKVSAGDLIVLSITASDLHDKTNIKLTASDIKLDILFEDDALIVINKPANLTVHPGAGNHDNTLVNALLSLYDFEYDANALHDARPGIVHRLDKDTSGLMIIAKNDVSHNILSEQFKNRSIIKKYVALVWGMPSTSSGTIDTYIARSHNNRKKMQVVENPLKGKQAITHYKVINVVNKHFTLLECVLETGRTHQIRVHLNHIGHPIVGDQVYGNNQKKINKSLILDKSYISTFERQALHAYYIKFSHPITNKEMEFEMPIPQNLPEDFKALFEVH